MMNLQLFLKTKFRVVKDSLEKQQKWKIQSDLIPKCPLKIKFGVEVVVSNQWGSKNIDAFLSLATKLKYNISEEVKEEEKSAIEETNVSSLSDESNGVKSYVYIKVYDDNTGNDLKLTQSTIVQTNGEYILSFDLDSDDGVIDQYRFYDIKTKVSGSNGSPWDFEEFY